MAGSIEKARREVAALQPPDSGNNKILSATNELDAIVSATERASFDILNSAERLMDLGAKLRKGGADPDLCTEVESEVMNIFTACSFQDLTGQRTSKVVNALRYIEQRVNAMIAIWGVEGVKPADEVPDVFIDKRPDAHLLNGPALDGQGVSQSDVDALFADPPPAPAPPPKPAKAAVPVSPPPPVPVTPPPTHPPAPPAVAVPAPPKAARKAEKAPPKPKAAAKPTPPPPVDKAASPPAPKPPAAPPVAKPPPAPEPPVVTAPPPTAPAPPAPPPPAPPPPAPPPPAPPPPPPAAAPAPKAALDQSAIDALFG
ncbi:protein phosphatase CheZ [Skermanella sp. TT6]|uniref:Protein phosphatase CheZ n=2 Tax=Skermanella cutis TaxID=2775420 RepID=A0ABX7BEK2_9PROT|nr:protein phosphatase CheZ [Skermanella sp. TT6]